KFWVPGPVLDRQREGPGATDPGGSTQAWWWAASERRMDWRVRRLVPPPGLTRMRAVPKDFCPSQMAERVRNNVGRYNATYVSSSVDVRTSESYSALDSRARVPNLRCELGL